MPGNYLIMDTEQDTPSTPAALAARQRNDEVCLVHGIDLSTKARSVYLFSEELQLNIQEAIDLAYVFVRQAEGSVDHCIQAQIACSGTPGNVQAACQASILSGGLTSLRLTLKAMVDAPVDSGLWKSAPPSISPRSTGGDNRVAD